MVCHQALDLLHRNRTTCLFLNRGYASIHKSARVDFFEPTQIGIHIEAKAVHRHKARRANTDGANLAHTCCSRVEPHSRSPLRAMRLDAVVADGADGRLLQRVDIVAQADADNLQIEYRVTDQLPRAVEGDIASAVDVKERGTERGEVLLRDEQVFALAALAQRIDRRMLHKEQLSGSSGRKMGRFASQRGIEEFLLQSPTGFILHRAEVSICDVHLATSSLRSLMPLRPGRRTLRVAQRRSNRSPSPKPFGGTNRIFRE